MVEFCECGSLMIGGNCSNKKCKHHGKELVELATFKQVETIRDMLNELGEEEEQYDFDVLSKVEAKRIIQELKERLEFQELEGVSAEA